MPSLHKAKLLLAKLGLAAKQQGRQQGDAAAPIQLQAGFDIERAVARVEQRLADLWSDARRRNTPSLPQAKQSAVQPAAAQPLQLQQVLGTNGVLRALILSSIGHLSHVFMTSGNSVDVQGAEIMQAALNRPPGQGLITACNHTSAADDPLVVASILPPEYYSKPKDVRWTLCASDRCFKYAALAPFFTAAKVLPVTRGAGLTQPGMQAAEDRLAAGDWVHIFPEGTRSRDPSHLGPIRQGIGRLVAASAGASGVTPLIVPFVHVGMHEVLPVGSVLPSVGKQVRVVVGEPVQVDDLLQRAREQGWGEDKLHRSIADRVGQRLVSMHDKLLGRHSIPAVVTHGAPSSTSQMSAPGFSQHGVAWQQLSFNMWHRQWCTTAAVSKALEEGKLASMP